MLKIAFLNTGSELNNPISLGGLFHSEFSLDRKRSYNVQFQKISILPQRKVFVLHPPSPPGNSSLASYFASKILTFKTPLPLGISNDLPWGGYGFFLELHNNLLWLSAA